MAARDGDGWVQCRCGGKHWGVNGAAGLLLIRDGKITRPGFGIQAASPQVHAALRLAKGIAVVGVLPRSPAEAAGIKPFMRGQRGEIIAGDIIVAMDNKLITNVDEFLEVIERHNAGDTIIVTVLRGGT